MLEQQPADPGKKERGELQRQLDSLKDQIAVKDADQKERAELQRHLDGLKAQIAADIEQLKRRVEADEDRIRERNCYE